MKLTLERTRMTTLWIDGRRVGSCDSLCTPHVYDITAYVTKPLVEILVLVENTGYPTKGGHLTSPDTQSNWNGITGQMTLEVFPEVYADHVQAYPNPAEKMSLSPCSFTGHRRQALPPPAASWRTMRRTAFRCFRHS